MFVCVEGGGEVIGIIFYVEGEGCGWYFYDENFMILNFLVGLGLIF